MDRYIYPNERIINQIMDELSGNDRWNKCDKIHSITNDLKEKAKNQNLWNLFLHGVSKLTNLEYSLLCQTMGRSIIAPEVFNCSAPDTGNMEVLFKYGNEKQKETYLKPLLDGKIRSCFAMTEKGVASSDATNLKSTITPIDNNKYLINGRKWYISGAGDKRCKIAIFMGITPDKNKSLHEQHSMIIIPLDSPGIRMIRPMKVLGYDDAPHGHMDIDFKNVIVDKENMILKEGKGFEIAQGRLGPGRIHHCMRVFGIAERAIENMIDRVQNRKAFGKMLMNNDDVMAKIANCKLMLTQSRLLVLFAANKIDEVGAKNAKDEIAMIKISAPRTVFKILDLAIQLFGAEGVSQDTFLAYALSSVRTLRIADGPDEVHLRTLGKSVIEFKPKF